ncbi:MAG: PorV/PorQ family protein, partial [Elusimicrobiota bacterium]
MGRAFCAVSDDANAVFSNPAGINYMVNPELVTSYRQGLIDGYYGSFGYLYPFDKTNGTMQAGLLIFDGGDIELNYLDGSAETVKAEQNSVFNVAYGNNFVEEFFWGLNAKYIRSALAGGKYSAQTLTADFGVLYRTPDNTFSLGAALINAGGGMKYKNATEPLPQEITAGIALKPLEEQSRSIIFSTEYSKRNDGAITTRLGAELTFIKLAALRAGYISSPGLDSALTAGFGLKTQGPSPLQIDYGYAPSGKFGTAHNVSFTMKFGPQDFYGAGEKYLSKEMSGRAKHFFEKVSKNDPKYAAAQERLSEIAAKMPEPEPANPAAIPAKPSKKIEKRNIAVADFAAKNVSAADASIVSDFIRTELVKSEAFKVMDRGNMEMLLAEQKFQLSGCTEQECAVKMGKLLSVGGMVVGAVSKLMDAYFITLNFVDVETGEIIRSYDEKATNVDELRNA